MGHARDARRGHRLRAVLAPHERAGRRPIRRMDRQSPQPMLRLARALRQRQRAQGLGAARSLAHPAEREAILTYHHDHRDEGYRRLAYMMRDADLVAARPATTYRVRNWVRHPTSAARAPPTAHLRRAGPNARGRPRPPCHATPPLPQPATRDCLTTFADTPVHAEPRQGLHDSRCPYQHGNGCEKQEARAPCFRCGVQDRAALSTTGEGNAIGQS